MRLHDRKNIQSVKSARSVVDSELKACILTPLEGINKGHKKNHTWMFQGITFFLLVFLVDCLYAGSNAVCDLVSVTTISRRIV